MEFGPIPESRFDEVIEHLRFSFPDEPLNVAIGLCQYGQACEPLEAHDFMTMKDGLSIMATDPKTGEVRKCLVQFWQENDHISCIVRFTRMQCLGFLNYSNSQSNRSFGVLPKISELSNKSFIKWYPFSQASCAIF